MTTPQAPPDHHHDRDAIAAVPTPSPPPGVRMLAELSDATPDEIPEVIRVATMTAGVADALHRAVAELEERLAHVLTDPTTMPPEVDDTPTPTTALGDRMVDTYRSLSSLEHRIHRLRARLEV